MGVGGGGVVGMTMGLAVEAEDVGLAMVGAEGAGAGEDAYVLIVNNDVSFITYRKKKKVLYTVQE